MTREERICLAKKLMRLEEEQGISPEVQMLGQEILAEALRLESMGEKEEARAFEAFLPLDVDYLSSLAPVLGQEEFDRTIALYCAEKKRMRLEYIAQRDN